MVLNRTVTTNIWNVSKTALMSLQPLLANKFNLLKSYKEFKENLCLIADNLKNLSVMMNEEGHPITSVAVTALITTLKLRLGK